MRRVLIDDHEAPERAPLTVVPGQIVSVQGWDTEWPAFVFVTAEVGSGWVPGRHLSISGTTATVVTGYDTTELTLATGAEVEVLIDDVESGWSWCRSDAGAEGWVPNRVLGDV